MTFLFLGHMKATRLHGPDTRQHLQEDGRSSKCSVLAACPPTAASCAVGFAPLGTMPDIARESPAVSAPAPCRAGRARTAHRRARGPRTSGRAASRRACRSPARRTPTAAPRLCPPGRRRAHTRRAARLCRWRCRARPWPRPALQAGPAGMPPCGVKRAQRRKDSVAWARTGLHVCVATAQRGKKAQQPCLPGPDGLLSSIRSRAPSFTRSHVCSHTAS
jgi:hypothetical protein